ncbi:PREDICTED: semaphorin-4D-like [Thamnophis sirtalis]|uniref:Semaphorin-4D-like n=1 Tax=Thamnophis sirtalis TaxID=35019 RepID=A0A6I9XLG1_9SAUR|nr:PREDICTED: semaphorin-4D-like [Thamnophis sirtalis]
MTQAECNNYILIMHKINATNLYICGTNAFHPACRYMVIDNMKLKLYTRATESRGRCPYEPTLSYASLMVDGALYTATSNNFLGTEPIILRSFRNPLRTEYKASWLNEPTFIHMELIQENEAVSDSDRIYVFFTETATEFEFYDKLRVSRVAQLCKGDLGGKRTLKKKWTSFLKSTLLCSIMETIQDNFLKGSFKGPVALENSHMKWVMYRGDVPIPRPGACADVSALHLGYTSSLDLPDKVLQFARDHPLMDSIVNSVGLQPVFLKRGTKYTQLIISQATDLDNVTYDIFFLGTEKKIRRYPVTLGSSPHLNCEPLSNTANLLWMFNKSRLLEEEAKYLIHTKGLVVFNVTVADTGLYECQSVEKVNGRTFRVTVDIYFLQPQPEKTFYGPKCDLSNQMCSEIAESNPAFSITKSWISKVKFRRKFEEYPDPEKE